VLDLAAFPVKDKRERANNKNTLPKNFLFLRNPEYIII
jgi:hypothetical protein